MIKEVMINIVSMFVLFVLNIYVISDIPTIIVEKFGNPWPKWLKQVEGYTVHVLAHALMIPFLFVTFNDVKYTDDWQFSWFKPDPDNPEDQKYFCSSRKKLFNRYSRWDGSSKYNWYNPIKQIGEYLSCVIWILTGPVIAILVLLLLLPDTFSSILIGLGSWTALASGALDLPYFVDMWNVFYDIVYNRLLVGGWNENPVFLIIFIILLVYLFSGTRIEWYEDNYTWTMMADIPRKNVDAIQIPNDFYAFPTMAILIIAFNVVFAILNPIEYTNVISIVNGIGMAVLLILLIKSVAYTVGCSIKNIIYLILDKKIKVKR